MDCVLRCPIATWCLLHRRHACLVARPAPLFATNVDGLRVREFLIEMADAVSHLRGGSDNRAVVQNSSAG